MTKIVLITHFNENVSWASKIVHETYFFDKTKQSINVGLEHWSTMKFIVDHYYCLPDRILVLHAHETSHHQDYPGWYIANNLNWSLDYVNVNTRRYEEQYFSKIYDFEDIENNYRKSFGLWMTRNWSDIFTSELVMPDTLTFLGYGQFMVSKSSILRHSKPFYERILKWLETTDIDKELYIGDINCFNRHASYVSSRIIEYNLHYIFTGNPEEILLPYIL